ncbi:AAA family ATPase [Rhizobium halophytocola]|uniref:Adenylate kinase family enzyme n=1 Tax=Rhizobium halophytocola TaxID=735519 RepID=A0ABS4E5T1_9HYPH|nr:AAA family ATPase [Rhizobium halophytocola]MBP1853306.1 adenylate kinase family enzyme [Rhizobium halophytocola]
MKRIHILGASGSGTSTLGAALGRHLGIPHVDSDSIYWLPTDPPFVEPRALEERHAMLRELLPADGHWIFSGSALKWAEPIEPYYDLVVFLQLDHDTRMSRILKREKARYGARIEEGGDMYVKSRVFLAWARAYDTAGLGQRSLLSHEKMLEARGWPVLRLDSIHPVEDLVAAVLAQLA